MVISVQQKHTLTRPNLLAQNILVSDYIIKIGGFQKVFDEALGCMLTWLDWVGNGGLMTTRVGLLRGGNGGVLSTLEVAPALAAAAAFKFLTVDTLKFEPSESLLDVMLNLDGDELPVEYGAVRPTTEILSVDADKTRPLTASTTGRFSIGWCRPVAADDGDDEEDDDDTRLSRSPYVSIFSFRGVRHYSAARCRLTSSHGSVPTFCYWVLQVGKKCSIDFATQCFVFHLIISWNKNSKKKLNVHWINDSRKRIGSNFSSRLKQFQSGNDNVREISDLIGS